MANSLLTGISGLRGHQKMLEVIGNNLANVNTTAFKSARTLFADLMYENNRGASSGTAGVVGSVNPLQVGTGSKVASVDMNFRQGNLEETGEQEVSAFIGGRNAEAGIALTVNDMGPSTYDSENHQMTYGYGVCLGYKPKPVADRTPEEIGLEIDILDTEDVFPVYTPAETVTPAGKLIYWKVLNGRRMLAMELCKETTLDVPSHPPWP